MSYSYRIQIDVQLRRDAKRYEESPPTSGSSVFIFSPIDPQ